MSLSQLPQDGHPLVDTGVWTNFTPTLTQSATVTATVTYSRYHRVGRKITYEFYLSVTGTGTAANNVLLTLPVANVQGGNMPAGSTLIYDSSANIFYFGMPLMGSTQIAFGSSSTDTSAFLGSAVFTAALASGDVVAGTVTYEATS